MKTLCEVIQSLEACTTGDSCNGCAYFNAHKDLTEGMNCDEYAIPEMQKDALHYLKEYRDKHDEMLKEEEALGYCEMAENRPLTWEELREMKHKPVWVETTLTEDKKMKTWYLICGIDDSFIWVADVYGGQHNFPRVCLDTNIWKAYRKERA